MQRMGQLAMEHLCKLMSGEESVVKVKVEAELIVRESTARVKRHEHGNRRVLTAKQKL